MNAVMQDTRRDILHHLRERGQASAQDLGKALGMSPVSIHYHLNVLQRDGLIDIQPVRRNIGRPHFVYSLRERARELFPQSYHRLADRLLDKLETQMSEQQIADLFVRIAEDIAAEHAPALDGKSLEDKLETLIEILGEEGYVARVEQAEGGLLLTQYGCPYYYVVERHPQVCELDLNLISAALATPVERQGCVLSGSETCTFLIRPEARTQQEAA